MALKVRVEDKVHASKANKTPGCNLKRHFRCRKFCDVGVTSWLQTTSTLSIAHEDNDNVRSQKMSLSLKNDSIYTI